jgi:hypothetical protein
MHDSLQTEQEGELQQPVEQQAEPQLSFIQRFQQKLAESRYFMLSCVIHTVIVIVMGSIVLYKAMVEPPDFVAEGGDGLISTAEDLAPAPEAPADAVPTDQQVAPTPSINSPTIDVIQTTSNTSTFKVAPTQVNVKINTNTTDLTKAAGNIAKMGGGLGGLPGTMKGRVGAGKAKAMADNKMKPAAEMAVMKGLTWLQKNQNSDGSWGDTNKAAMTGLGLLCFLGHGETPESQQFGFTVNKAVEWILTNGAANEGRLHMRKSFDQPGVYEHAIVSYALGEYYTMTQDVNVRELFKQAIGYIVQGQGPGGGWMYSYDKTADDLSVSGWQIQALKAAHLSKLGIYGVDEALDKAMLMLEKFRGPKGGYGYRGPADTYSLSGVGILCQLFWKGEKGALKKGMEWVLDETEKNSPVKYQGPKADLYAWYYHTQACLMFGGSAWTKWNRWFQDEIVSAQASDGSWPPMAANSHGNLQGGKTMAPAVYRTTLCVLMLEVFYRYMPTNREG